MYILLTKVILPHLAYITTQVIFPSHSTATLMLWPFETQDFHSMEKHILF